MKKRLYSVKDAAEYLNLSSRTIYNWINTGKCLIPYKKLGRLIKFDILDLEKFVNRMPKYGRKLAV